MPPPLPPRYVLEVRLDRDDDIEQWLATDESLSRPVLVRFLGADSDDERRHEFLEQVRAAAAVNHPHLASVFNAESGGDAAYSVSEWSGGVTLADRVASGEMIAPDEFLPNAAGLADALAALHAEGHLHGAIDPAAVFHTVAHPARLGAFGRVAVDHTPREDVQSLSAVLEFGLTGSEGAGPPPSEIVDGLDPTVDRALRSARQGHLTARQFADLLRAAPSPVPVPPDTPQRSRRFLALAASLVLIGVLLVALGRVFIAGEDGPPIFPSTTAVTDTIALPSTTSSTSVPTQLGASTTVPLVDLRVVSVQSVDPFGGNEENDERLDRMLDGDADTAWRTESYRDPLPLLKDGVGVAFTLGEAPRELVVIGLEPGTVYELAWSAGEPDPETWDTVARGIATSGTVRHQLPQRDVGTWVLWFTDLPVVDSEDRATQVAEVRFRR